MYGDFSRWTHDPTTARQRVLFQQGRVTLDADLNEQAAILLRELRAIISDLAGPDGAAPFEPAANSHFQIAWVDDALTIGAGRYWVGGLRCENPEPCALDEQPPTAGAQPPPIEGAGPHLLFLDAWERTVHPEQEAGGYRPPMAEVALGGPDTAARSEVVWRVRAIDVAVTTKANARNRAREALARLRDRRRGQLAAVAKRDEDEFDPCLVLPEATFAGVENQLYRIEILTSGRAWDRSELAPSEKRGSFPPGKAPDEGAEERFARFVWSRDNGSVVFPAEKVTGHDVVLARPPRDARTALSQDDWVEVLDARAALLHDALDAPRRLHQVARVDDCDVELRTDPFPEGDPVEPIIVRRWDSRPRPLADDAPWFDEGDGGLLLEEGRAFLLEAGVTITFRPPSEGVGDADDEGAKSYRAGDFWLVPARVATGDVEWPRAAADGTAEWMPPHGVDHQFAPLAIAWANADGGKAATPTNNPLDLRSQLIQGWQPVT